jgi:F0F1-type ATP synthase delta subunit
MPCPHKKKGLGKNGKRKKVETKYGRNTKKFVENNKKIEANTRQLDACKEQDPDNYEIACVLVSKHISKKRKRELVKKIMTRKVQEGRARQNFAEVMVEVRDYTGEDFTGTMWE